MRVVVLAAVGVLLLLAPLRADYVEGIAAFKRGDYVTAHREFLAPATQGRAAAQFNVGFLYYYGLGVDKDHASAVEWYRKAADQGLVEAQFSLGTVYEAGTGVPRNLVEAYRWYDLAAENVARGEIRDRLIKHRDRVAGQLSPDQLAAAEAAAVAAATALATVTGTDGNTGGGSAGGPVVPGSDAGEAVPDGVASTERGDEPDRRAAPTPSLADVQRKLADRGFDPGTIDGRMSRRTAASLSVFQAAHGLTITGRPDEATLEKLFGSDEVAPRLEPFPRVAVIREDKAPPAVPVPPVEMTALAQLDRPTGATEVPAADRTMPLETAAQGSAPTPTGDGSPAAGPTQTAAVHDDDVTAPRPDSATDEPSNAAPSDISLTGGMVVEHAAGGTAVARVSTTDPDAGDSFTYSLIGDAGGRFAIDAETGSIRVAQGARLDFEAAAGHQVTVRVTDAGGLSYDEGFAIAVTDVNEAPSIVEATFLLEENAADDAVVGRVSASDPDAGERFTYSLIDDAGGRFAIDPDSGVVTVAEGARLDFEDRPSFELTVAATDRGGLGASATLVVDLADVNEAPGDIGMSGDTVVENAAAGTLVTRIVASDPDAGDSFTYSLTGDAGGRFAIDAETGAITVAEGARLDFESAAGHQVTVRVTDAGGLSHEEALTIAVADVSEAPGDIRTTGDRVAENAVAGTPVATLSASDPDAGERLTYSLIEDASGRFAIDAETGAITVAEGARLDFESAAGHQVTVRVTDAGGLSHEEALAIAVVDVNEAPGDIRTTGDRVAENAAAGTPVTTIVASDPDTRERLTYSLIEDAGGRFAIDADSGLVMVAEGARLDFEAAAGHEITVRVTDSGGLSYDEGLAIAVVDVNEAPRVEEASLVLSERAVDGATVGRIGATDPDAGDSFTYGLPRNAGGRFAIDPQTGTVTVAEAVRLDFEQSPAFELTVIATDRGGLVGSATLVVNLTDVNEAPSAIRTVGDAVAENAAAGTVAATLSTSDPDAGERLTYSLIGDAGGRFALDPEAGTITVAVGARLDFEAAAAHEVTVRVTDSGGLSRDEVLAIAVADVNEAPTAMEDILVGLDENTAPGTAVARIGATDPDAGERLTYGLTEDAGGRFAIDPDSGLVTVAEGARLDFEDRPGFELTVAATDRGGLSDTVGLSVDLADVNEAPRHIWMTLKTVAENATAGTLVGTLAATDQDAGDSFTYSLIGDAGRRFAIEADTEAITVAEGARLDFEAAAGHRVTVRVTDTGGLSYDEGFAIAVADVNEAPRIEEATFLLEESARGGAAVGRVSASDPDTGERLTYSLIGDAGGRFAIDPDSGLITVAEGARLDFEEAAGHRVTVRVTDSSGLSRNQALEIAVADVNEAPGDFRTTGDRVAENAVAGTPVATIAASDPDTRERLTYSLIEDAGGRFAIDPETGVITVANGARLDFEEAAGHAITVRVTDAGGLSREEALAIAVVDVNEAPGDIRTTRDTVAENAAAGTPVTMIAASDPDTRERLTYSLIEDAGGRFAIDPDSGVVTVAEGARLDFEEAAGHQVTVRVADADGLGRNRALAIVVADVNEAPSDIGMTGGTLAENAAEGTVVGKVGASDPDTGERLTYSLIEDAGGRFTIDPDRGVVRVAEGARLDFEDRRSFELTVAATDRWGLGTSAVLSVDLVDFNEAPGDIRMTGGSVAEQAADGAVVGRVTAADPDAGEKLAYSLVEDAGGRFAIEPDSGRITVADGSRLDFEEAARHEITVRVTDSGGLSRDEVLAIAIADVNEPPRLDAAALVLKGHATGGATVGRVGASDPDAGERLTYSLIDDAGGRFAIDARTGTVTVANGTSLDFEASPSFELKVAATDRGGLSHTATLTVSLTATNGDARLEDDRIALIQQQLDVAGFDPGPIDGKMGPQTREALESYLKAIKAPADKHEEILDSLVAKAHFMYAYDYQKLGKYEKSIKEYSTSIEINPKYYNAYLNRGLIYYTNGHYDRAIEDFDSVISLEPDNSRAFFNRGNSYYMKGLYGDAIQDYLNAVRYGIFTW